MNRLVTGNLSLVSGDLQRSNPRVSQSSITSYQLPVTSLNDSWSQCAVNKPWRFPRNRFDLPPGLGARQSSGAFARLELLAILGALALLAALALPVLAQGKPRSQQAVCLNNLRLIGRALLVWDTEHGQTDPWRIPHTSENPLTGVENNSWFQFVSFSNELQTPKILACPSDFKRPAKDFSFSADGGFLNPNYRNRSVSYFLGLDSVLTWSQSLLSGDRNVRMEGFSGCSSGLNPVPFFSNFGFSRTSWTNALHGMTGNLLLHDGHVEQSSSQGLNRLVLDSRDDNGHSHLLIPF